MIGFSVGTLLGGVLLLALVTGVLWLRAFARGFLRAKGRKGARRADQLGLPTTPFEVARPGGSVRGALIHGASGAAPTVIITHGWQSHASDMLAYAEPLLRAGYHVALFDTLGHGESDASEFTSARHFTEDLLAVWRWASARGETRPGIVLAGHSLGGTAALLAAAEGLGEGLLPSAIVTIGSPSDPVQGTEEWLASKGYPAALMMKALRGFWRPIMIWTPDRLRPVQRAAEIRAPLLVMHGTKDRQIGVHHARALAAAIPGAHLALLEGADHWTVPRHPEFAPTIVSFLDSVFGHTSASR
jgi:pimeloyl-ACP methyl ester carboxylesterase